MEVIVIDSQAFEELYQRLLKQMKAELQEMALQASEKQWLTQQEAQKILPYRSKTKWQELRDNGQIEFSQFGRKILYSRTSIEEYVKQNKKDTF